MHAAGDSLTSELSLGAVPTPSWRGHSSDDARRLRAIIREIPNSPNAVLARSVAEALLLCGAHSAGIDIVDESRPFEEIRRPAIVGPLAALMDSGVSGRWSPSHIVIDQTVPQVLRPGGRFPYLAEWQPSVVEMLLVPFAMTDHATGAIWVVSHEDTRTFDGEDQRRLADLALCASACYQLAVTLVDFANEASAPRRTSGLSGLNATLAASEAVTPGPVWAQQRLLSRREQQVCRLVAHGHTSAAIAAALDVNEKTVGTYRARIADKLGFRTRADFVTYAVAQGWLQSL